MKDTNERITPIHIHLQMFGEPPKSATDYGEIDKAIQLALHQCFHTKTLLCFVTGDPRAI
jgi:hypothetical protein